MFKKIEIWILYLVLIFSILFAVAFGVLVRQELVGSTKVGWLSKTALSLAEIPMNIKVFLKEMDANLMTEDRFPSLDGFNGDFNSKESYLLLSRYDGDLEEGIVELIDLTNFKVLHTWNPDIDEFNNMIDKVDEFKYLTRDANNKRHLLYNPILLERGDLVFHAFVTPLRKIDSCSKLIFQNKKDIFHHSIEKDIQGNIWTSSHLYPQNLSYKKVGRKIPGDGGYYDDAIVKLSSDGKILYEKSISEILIDNGMESRLSMVGTSHEFQLDPIHVNDIQPVNFDGKFWKKGDLFISLGHQSMVILFRPSTEKIVWKYDKNIFHQHDINIINENKISIFNNNRKYFHPDKDVVDGHNEVLIYNFVTKKAYPYLKDSLINEDVRTKSQGRSHILPNGDLFIEETNFARTIYFNEDGSVRWTYVNRAENGNVYVVGWSRILYTKKDIQMINNFVENKRTCNE
jgi:hypothetical protein